jgi:hypothetical protein
VKAAASTTRRETLKNAGIDPAPRRRVLLKIVYLLTCRVLGVAVLVFRRDRAKTAELLVLRRESAVLRRHVSRVRYHPADRVWFAALTRLLPPEALARDLPP